MSNDTLIHPDFITRPAVIVGLQAQASGEDGQSRSADVDADLDELESLLATLSIRTAGRVIQRRGRLSASHLLGLGKIEEIKTLVAQAESRLVIIDHPLSGPQVRNLEKFTDCQVLDRSGVILDIFARHAKSNQARTQVEIAQLEYLLPRLSGVWTHFQRQAGGVRSRGMGEKQIEIDRRRARERIQKLQRRLESISQERQTQSKRRQGELRVALVGYTNCGKTTLMKSLTRAVHEGKDALFATLDPSTRMLDPSTRPRILLSDTVGFIRNLPHSLVASFKSTLDEVATADLLLHVVDLSAANYSDQMRTTDEVLAEIGAGEIPRITIFNKLDALAQETFLPRVLERNHPGCLVISAFSPEHIHRLRHHVFAYFETRFKIMELAIPAADPELNSVIHRYCVILSTNYEIQGQAIYRVRVPERIRSYLERYAQEQVANPGTASPPLF